LCFVGRICQVFLQLNLQLHLQAESEWGNGEGVVCLERGACVGAIYSWCWTRDVCALRFVTRNTTRAHSRLTTTHERRAGDATSSRVRHVRGDGEKGRRITHRCKISEELRVRPIDPSVDDVDGLREAHSISKRMPSNVVLGRTSHVSLCDLEPLTLPLQRHLQECANRTTSHAW
jgi:hypothetical protein